MNTDEIRIHFEEMIDMLPPELENNIEGYIMGLMFEENFTDVNIGFNVSQNILLLSQQAKIDVLLNFIKTLNIDIDLLVRNYL